ncbi:MAG: hypothetical protein ACW98Y_10610, partial [Candidatus Thorarchaeota archaeon]
MSEKKTKKVYGKIDRTSENTITIDPVFGSKVECSVEASLIGEIPQTEENINVIITDDDHPQVVEFLVSKQTDASIEPEVKSPVKDKELAGAALHVRGRILSSELNDVGGAQVG